MAPHEEGRVIDCAQAHRSYRMGRRCAGYRLEVPCRHKNHRTLLVEACVTLSKRLAGLVAWSQLGETEAELDVAANNLFLGTREKECQDRRVLDPRHSRRPQLLLRLLLRGHSRFEVRRRAAAYHRPGQRT